MKLSPQQQSLSSVACSLILIVSCMSTVVGDNKSSDRLALLAFKDGITEDPLGVLSTWNNNNDSIHYCDWRGVTCSGRHHSKVTKLDLNSQKLVGSVSPHIGNLSFLQELILRNNSFTGVIPQQIGRLFRLKSLSLSYNIFQGEIPENISRCSNLIHLNITNNKLVGSIPNQLSYLSNLRILDLRDNQLSGVMPTSLANLSSLTHLYLRSNYLEGTFPSTLSQLTSLKVLELGMNNLSEYGVGGEVSTLGDVYSYGILLLEMFTGKRPTDDMFKDGLNIHKFSKMHALPDRVLDIVDARLLLELEGEDLHNNETNNFYVRRSERRNRATHTMRQTLASIIQIGVICSSELPSNRINMNEVIVDVQAVKNRFLGIVV